MFFHHYHDHHHDQSSSSTPGDNEESRSWIGFVESRIRQISSPKYLGGIPPVRAPIHLHPVVSKTQKSAKAVCYFIGFNVDESRLPRGSKELYLDDCISRFRLL